MPFVKGQSGNPGGRSAGLSHIRELAREKTELALNTLVQVAESGESDAARVAAANALLDRAWGKPSQPIDGDGEGGAIRSLVEIRFVKPGDGDA